MAFLLLHTGKLQHQTRARTSIDQLDAHLSHWRFKYRTIRVSHHRTKAGPCFHRRGTGFGSFYRKSWWEVIDYLRVLTPNTSTNTSSGLKATLGFIDRGGHEFRSSPSMWFLRLRSRGRKPSIHKPVLHREAIIWWQISCKPQDTLQCIEPGIQVVLRLPERGRAPFPLEPQICGQIFHSGHHNCLQVHLPGSTNRSMITRESFERYRSQHSIEKCHFPGFNFPDCSSLSSDIEWL